MISEFVYGFFWAIAQLKTIEIAKLSLITSHRSFFLDSGWALSLSRTADPYSVPRRPDQISLTAASALSPEISIIKSFSFRYPSGPLHTALLESLAVNQTNINFAAGAVKVAKSSEAVFRGRTLLFDLSEICVGPMCEFGGGCCSSHLPASPSFHRTVSSLYSVQPSLSVLIGTHC